MSRKMASIQRIWKVEKHPNADALDIVNVMGWKCVSKLNEFKDQDLCVYFEIDSILPEIPQFEFMRQSRFRVKTKKLRGEISQGIALPLSSFEQDFSSMEVGADLTEILNVKKYEEYEKYSSTETRGGFPGWLIKTDQERIQNLSFKQFENYKNLLWEVTEKIEGQSGQFAVRDGEFYCFSRNLMMKTTEGSVWKHLNDKYSLEQKLIEFHKNTGRNISIQGEIVGPGIQKNIYNLKSPDYFIFDIFDIDTQKFLLPNERKDVLSVLGLSNLQTPVIFESFDFYDKTKDELISLADGKSVLYNTLREGLVYKCLSNSQFHFKTVSNQYLLKKGE